MSGWFGPLTPDDIDEHAPDADDIRILENRTYEHIEDGCDECGFLHIIFQAAISIERNSKVFILSVECPNCSAEYKVIMDVKLIED